MRRSLFFILCLLISNFLVSCAPASSGALFFYIRQGATPTLVLLDSPQSNAPLDEIPLAAPPDCGFWSLTPAPSGPLAALEWQCSFGLVTQLVDTKNKRVIPLVDGPTSQSHFLGWSADGQTIYIKVATTTDPKILSINTESRLPTVLTQVSPNTYNLTTSPAGDVLIWAFSDGLHLGSQIWGSQKSGKPQIIFSDPGNIISFMRYAPDGKRIAAIRIPDDTRPFPPGALWLVDSDGKHARFAAVADGGRGMFPVWAPNGEQIAFIGRNQPEDPTSINLSILTLSDFIPATFDLQPILPPVWSLDGKGLYLTLAAGDKMDVWFYEIETGKTTKRFENACCAGWIMGGK